MITQCPKCKRKQPTPDIYANRQIKCIDCKADYTALEYREPEAVLPPEPKPVPGEPFPWRVAFYILIQFMAVVWFIAAALTSSTYSAYDFPDTVWRELLVQLVFGLYGIQCLLAACLFCLASLAMKK